MSMGTVKNGVYILSESGALVHHINVDNGLNNDTVLSVFSENRGVWLGLDDGLAGGRMLRAFLPSPHFHE